MKRFIVVCLCFSLLSLLIIPIFAEERYFSDIDFSVRNISPGSSYSVLFFAPQISSVHPLDVTVSVSGYYIRYGSVQSFTSLTLHSSQSASILTCIHDGSSETLINQLGTRVNSWDGYVYFDSPTQLPQSFVDWYNTLPEPVDNFGVSSGVTSFISWTGNVLTDLFSNPAILVLVCLSIAMLAVLPWGISKIKSLIKGY